MSSTESHQSLRQTLLDYSTKDGEPQLSQNDLETILDCVKQWLEQKRINNLHWIGKTVYDELIGELSL